MLVREFFVQMFMKMLFPTFENLIDACMFLSMFVCDCVHGFFGIPYSYLSVLNRL